MRHEDTREQREKDDARLERIRETLFPTRAGYCAEPLDIEDARWLFALIGSHSPSPSPPSAEKQETVQQIIEAFLIHCDSRPICDYCDVKFDTGEHHSECLVARAIALHQVGCAEGTNERSESSAGILSEAPKENPQVTSPSPPSAEQPEDQDQVGDDAHGGRSDLGPAAPSELPHVEPKDALALAIEGVMPFGYEVIECVDLKSGERTQYRSNVEPTGGKRS